MKKIKIILIVLILLLVTGCSGTYDLNISKELRVKEELNLKFEGEADNYNKFNTLLKENNVDEESYKLSVKENDLSIAYSQDYDSIEDYILNSVIYKQLFNNIDYETNGKELILHTSNIFNTTNSGLNNSNNIKMLQINVTTPLMVVEENSDISSKNTYTWNINNKTKEKEMYLVFYPMIKKVNTGSIIVLCTIGVVSLILIGLGVKKLLESNKI